jgi:hypothetical protein
MRNTVISLCNSLQAIPYFASLGNEIVVRIDDETCRDLLVKLQMCQVVSSYSPASADTQASIADAVNVAACFLTNSCTLSGPCPVSVSTSSDIRS